MNGNHVFDYSTFTQRNSAYIQGATQKRIRDCTLLIAGCGIGSGVAICAARTGFENFILADGDVIGQSNLNRQFFDFADIGRLKVDALKDHILRINPDAKVETVPHHLDAANTEAVVARSDLVFDTIDFLALPAIHRLHGAARDHRKPIITAFNVGFGAFLWYFPADGMSPAIDAYLTLPGEAESNHLTYAEAFSKLFAFVKDDLDAEVVAHVSEIIGRMTEGTPCPASQVAAGGFAVAAMAVSTICSILEGLPVPSSPQAVVHSFRSNRTRIVNFPAAPEDTRQFKAATR